MFKQRLLSTLKWTLYAALFLLSILLQTMIPAGRGLPGLPVFCVPVCVCCVALHEGAEKGGLFALIGATVWCLSGTDFGSAQIITLTVIGVLSGGLCQVLLTRRFLPAMLLSAGALALNEGLLFGLRLYLGGASQAQLITVLLPALGVSMLCAPLLYLFTRLIAKLGRNGGF